MKRASTHLFVTGKQLLAYLLVILIPAIMTILLLKFALNTDLFQHHPFWSDEVDYWTQINAFKQVGFASGNFTVNELTSNSSFSHYGTHGPIYPMLMGLLARVFGWKEFSGPLYNLAFLCSAMLGFLVIAKPSLKQCLFLGLIQFFNFMVLLYIPTSMQDSLHFSIAILYSGLFIRLFIYKDNRLGIYISLLALVFFAALLRILWVLAAFPVLFQLFTHKKYSNKQFWLSVLCMVSFGLISALLYMDWTSPFTAGSVYQLQNARSLAEIWNLLTVILQRNISGLFSLDPISGLPVKTDAFMRYSYLVLMVILVIVARKEKRVFFSLSYLMASSLLITLLIYQISNFRILSVFSLIALMVLVFTSESRLIKNVMILYVIAGLLSREQFVKDYQVVIGPLFGDTRSTAGQSVEIGLDMVKYIDNPNPWCNSILTTRIYKPEFVVLRAGIGTNVIVSADETFPEIKSHYLLVSQDFLDRHNLGSKCSVLQRYDQDVLCERTDDGCN